ncbi:MAG: hypothetical protein IKN43_02750 [Selenomonadaceae bacterium]|nr:hypothetical protein [Selenomonadaceae bacterium]
MTALQEKEIKNEMLDCLEQMDGQDILLLLNIAKRFINTDDLEDVLAEDDDLKAIEEAEKEFAAGTEYIMQI